MRSSNGIIALDERSDCDCNISWNDGWIGDIREWNESSDLVQIRSVSGFDCGDGSSGSFESIGENGVDGTIVCRNSSVFQQSGDCDKVSDVVDWESVIALASSDWNTTKSKDDVCESSNVSIFVKGDQSKVRVNGGVESNRFKVRNVELSEISSIKSGFQVFESESVVESDDVVFQESLFSGLSSEVEIGISSRWNGGRWQRVWVIDDRSGDAVQNLRKIDFLRTRDQ